MSQRKKILLSVVFLCLVLGMVLSAQWLNAEKYEIGQAFIQNDAEIRAAIGEPLDIRTKFMGGGEVSEYSSILNYAVKTSRGKYTANVYFRKNGVCEVKIFSEDDVVFSQSYYNADGLCDAKN